MKRLWLVAAAALGLAGCTARNFASDNRADVLLRINSITDKDDKLPIFSDTGPINPINDLANVTIGNVPKNPAAGTTAFDDVLLDSYTVEYFRSDGRDVEGVDVPFHISGAISDLVPASGILKLPLNIVRHQAKLEPPLRNINTVVGSLVESGVIVLNVNARVTVYGKTTTGKDVSAVGTVEIVFGDFTVPAA